MVPIYHHRKEATRIVLVTIIKTRTLLVHNRTKRIASKCHIFCSLCSNQTNLLINVPFFSQPFQLKQRKLERIR